MTLIMADSITPENLPAAYGIYLVYVDGLWQTAVPVRRMFPHARLLSMTVLGGQADGCDCESGDLTPAQAAAWAKRRLAAGAWRPVVYASRDAVGAVLFELNELGIVRSQVRILSAHYGQGPHICSPAACMATFTADGTQYTSSAAGVGGTRIDLSLLDDDFFGVVNNVTDIPLDICGTYTDGSGSLYAVGTDKDGVLHESKRTAAGVWSAPYQIAGKTGA